MRVKREREAKEVEPQNFPLKHPVQIIFPICTLQNIWSRVCKHILIVTGTVISMIKKKTSQPYFILLFYKNKGVYRGDTEEMILEQKYHTRFTAVFHMHFYTRLVP